MMVQPVPTCSPALFGNLADRSGRGRLVGLDLAAEQRPALGFRRGVGR